MTRDKLDAAIKGAASDRIDAAVAAGKLTKAQGDEIKKRLESTTGLPLGGLGLGLRARRAAPGRPRRRSAARSGFGFGHGKSLSAAASFLGLTEAQLRAQLQAGKSLADIAKAQGQVRRPT